MHILVVAANSSTVLRMERCILGSRTYCWYIQRSLVGAEGHWYWNRRRGCKVPGYNSWPELDYTSAWSLTTHIGDANGMVTTVIEYAQIETDYMSKALEAPLEVDIDAGSQTWQATRSQACCLPDWTGINRLQ